MPPKRAFKDATNSHPTAAGPKTTLARQKRKRLIVGVDFGTTYTSVCYSIEDIGPANAKPLPLCDGLSKVIPVNKWQGNESLDVPTTLVYDAQARARDPLWGFEAESPENFGYRNDVTEIRLAKLILHSSEETAEVVTGLEHQSQKLGKNNAMGLIEDYLRLLHKALMAPFPYEGCFESIIPGILSLSEVKWIIGVPAAWTESEQAQMATAARNAGLDPVSLVSEPEAMAFTYFAKPRSMISVSDTYVICDCGGGTVDIASYTVTAVDPIRVREAAVVEGSLCGSIYLNKNFQKLVKKRLSGVQGLNQSLEESILIAEEEFERTLKVGFGNSTNRHQRYFIKLPGLKRDEDKRFVDGLMEFSSEELRLQVFDPLINQIIKLLEKHLDLVQGVARSARGKVPGAPPKNPANIKEILIGGGFGKSDYLLHQIRAHFAQKNTHRSRLPVSRADLNKDSVAKGAVLFGLCEGFVSSRNSDKNYGVMTLQKYDPKDHGPLEDNALVKETGDVSRIWMIEWIIGRGRPLKMVQTFRRPRFVTVRPRSNASKTVDVSHIETVYESTEINWNETFLKIPGETIPNSCQGFPLHITFKDYPVSKLEWNEDAKSKVINYDIFLAVENNKMRWKVETAKRNAKGESYAVTAVLERKLSSLQVKTGKFGTLWARAEPNLTGDIRHDTEDGTDLQAEPPRKKTKRTNSLRNGLSDSFHDAFEVIELDSFESID